MKTTSVLFAFLTVFFLLTSCGKDDDSANNTTSGNATLKILLTDAPAAYDAVNIHILSVSVHVDSGWYDLPLDTPGIYNLIELSNGNTALLINSGTIPAGTISQMRLLLGDSNTIVVDGVTNDLKTPSGQSSGYKVKMNAVVEPGAAYQVLIDFDAEKSIVEQGNGNYLLKPVVYGSLVTAIGQIDGIVVPAAAGSLASAWNAMDTLNVYPDTTGFFLINSLTPGVYTVRITCNAPYNDTTILNVPVTAGQVTHLDSVFVSN